MAEKAQDNAAVSQHDLSGRKVENEGGEWGCARPWVVQVKETDAEGRLHWLWEWEGKKLENWRKVSLAVCPKEARGLPTDHWDPSLEDPLLGCGHIPSANYIFLLILTLPFAFLKKNDSIPNLGSKLAPVRETKTWAIVPSSGKQKEGS